MRSARTKNAILTVVNVDTPSKIEASDGIKEMRIVDERNESNTNESTQNKENNDNNGTKFGELPRHNVSFSNEFKFTFLSLKQENCRNPENSFTQMIFNDVLHSFSEVCLVIHFKYFYFRGGRERETS